MSRIADEIREELESFLEEETDYEGNVSINAEQAEFDHSQLTDKYDVPHREAIKAVARKIAEKEYKYSRV